MHFYLATAVLALSSFGAARRFQEGDVIGPRGKQFRFTTRGGNDFNASCKIGPSLIDNGAVLRRGAIQGSDFVVVEMACKSGTVLEVEGNQVFSFDERSQFNDGHLLKTSCEVIEPLTYNCTNGGKVFTEPNSICDATKDDCFAKSARPKGVSTNGVFYDGEFKYTQPWTETYDNGFSLTFQNGGEAKIKKTSSGYPFLGWPSGFIQSYERTTDELPSCEGGIPRDFGVKDFEPRRNPYGNLDGRYLDGRKEVVVVAYGRDTATLSGVTYTYNVTTRADTWSTAYYNVIEYNGTCQEAAQARAPDSIQCKKGSTVKVQRKGPVPKVRDIEFGTCSNESPKCGKASDIGAPIPRKVQVKWNMRGLVHNDVQCKLSPTCTTSSEPLDFAFGTVSTRNPRLIYGPQTAYWTEEACEMTDCVVGLSGWGKDCPGGATMVITTEWNKSFRMLFDMTGSPTFESDGNCDAIGEWVVCTNATHVKVYYDVDCSVKDCTSYLAGGGFNYGFCGTDSECEAGGASIDDIRSRYDAIISKNNDFLPGPDAVWGKLEDSSKEEGQNSGKETFESSDDYKAVSGVMSFEALPTSLVAVSLVLLLSQE